MFKLCTGLQIMTKTLPSACPHGRFYAFKSELKIKWVRPEKISCILPEKSGDQSGLQKVDMNQSIPEFRESEELKSADNIVKSIFSLQNNRRKFTSNLYREAFVKDVQRHSLDLGSMEAKLGIMTATIRRHQEMMSEQPRNKRLKVQLKELIDKRKKYLKFLRRWDYRRFEWLLEKLDLIYKPPPPEFHWITRKDSLRKLTDIYCEDMKKERLAEYRNQLEAQQVGFLEEKLKNLQFIRKEQEECQMQVTVSQESINETMKQLEKLRKKYESEGNLDSKEKSG